MQLTKWKNMGILIYWLFALLYWETLAHGAMYDRFQISFRFALGFAAAIALMLGALTGLLPRKAALPVNLMLSLVLMVVYGSQMVYCFIFGTPYSVSQMGMGADAMTQFSREMISAMLGHFPWLLAMLLPYPLLILLFRADALHCGRKVSLSAIILSLAVVGLTWMGIRAGGTGMYSDYYFFTSTKSTTTQTLERFGVPTTFYLELTHTEDPEEEMEEVLVVYTEPTVPPPADAADAAQEEIVYPYNTLDLDFDALDGATDNPKLQALNNYISQLPGTKQNAYTGMLKDYNLILLCAESFSPAAVDPVITPTLYKLTHEGFLFRNFYNSFPNTTIDGEYALTQGLYPDSARGKDDSSMRASSTHYLPFTLGNIFTEQRGIPSFGYHNNYGSFYNREDSHPNMGYTMKFTGSGMTFGGEFPTSDLQMMEQTVDDFIHEPQFHAYYMTFSGHYQYNPAINSMADKNFKLVEDLPDYDMEQKAYFACHIELDKALEYLLQRLDEAGIAEKTAIVMVGDHFPYGLSKKEYFGILNQPEDFFAAYKSDLVFWVGGMEEPIEVEPYCCNVDVLPTILNLWGFDFDSRMLPGTDIFSDGLHAAVLIDRSFLTDQAWFNSNTGEIRPQIPEDQLPENYVENMNRLIAARFDFSAQIMRNDYYRHALG